MKIESQILQAYCTAEWKEHPEEYTPKNNMVKINTDKI